MQRLSSWLIGLLAVAVFAAAAYVVTDKEPVRDAGRVLPVDSATAAPAAPSTVASSGTARTDGPGRTVVFLGDDWTVGLGASSSAKRFSTLVAKQLGVVERNVGADGTGYAKATAAAGAYDARLDAVVAARPAVVVVTGGRNDTSDYLPTLRSRIKALFADLHRRLPGTSILAVAPMWGDSAAPAELGAVAAAVKQYVTAVGGTYVDVTDPIRGHPSYMADAADPNDMGYAAIADALTPRLRDLLA